MQAYLGILGSLWTSVVSVADLLQTDDLFQLAKPRELPELPDLDNLPHWLCPHHRQPAARDLRIARDGPRSALPGPAPRPRRSRGSRLCRSHGPWRRRRPRAPNRPASRRRLANLGRMKDKG